MSNPFYNPYQFIPVTGKVNDHPTTSFSFNAIKEGYKNSEKMDRPYPTARHDFWQPKTYSGRILCQLTNETPIFIGAKIKREATETKAGEITPFELNSERAIPANSLKGMVSSVAETLSQSALRVLEDKHYSVRDAMKKSLSAVGLLKKGANGQWSIFALTLPNWSRSRGKLNSKWLSLFNSKWLSLFNSELPINQILTCYCPRNEEGLCSSTRSGPFYYMNLHQSNRTLKDFIQSERLDEDSFFKLEMLYTKNGNMILGQRHNDKPKPKLYTQAEYNQKSDQEKQKYTKGYLLAASQNIKYTDDENKRHELFIPHKELDRPIAIPENVQIDFEKTALLRAREDEQLPYLPHGYKHPENDSNGNPVRQLQDGHLIYFDINKEGKVSKLSYSPIWRTTLPTSQYDFFKKDRLGTSNHLTPWGSPDRENLSPAEALFGVVEEEKDASKAPRNLAGRVRFSNAFIIGDSNFNDSVTLKKLDSPKPPSSAMYFHDKKFGYIKKSQLGKRNTDLPNGRKIYIHHDIPDDELNSYFRTALCNYPHDQLKGKNGQSMAQHQNIKPIPKGEQFFYHVDFENLSAQELELLLQSLNPDPTFRFKLGIGKPLGLGTVKNRALATLFIERTKRYSIEGLNEGRYHSCMVHDLTPLDLTNEKVANFYSQEIKVLNDEKIEKGSQRYENELKETAFKSLVDRTTLDRLKVAGNPDNTKGSRVTYPLSDQQFISKDPMDAEDKGFTWFVHNDDKDTSHPQWLGNITGNKIKTLTTNVAPKRNRDRNRDR